MPGTITKCVESSYIDVVNFLGQNRFVHGDPLKQSELSLFSKAQLTTVNTSRNTSYSNNETKHHSVGHFLHHQHQHQHVIKK